MRQSNQYLATYTVKSQYIREQGFGLVELVVAMAIMGILITITLPAMDSMLLSGRLRSYSNELLASAYLARSEAIKTNAVVRLCASASGTACDGSWEQGWVVLRSDDAVIESHAALTEGFVINGSVTTLSFKPTGIGATQATLTVCKSGGDQSRVVTVNASGRPSVTKESGGC
ncbi:MAG: GspH/FimT family pseudopilin [Methylotenera sp.]